MTSCLLSVQGVLDLSLGTSKFRGHRGFAVSSTMTRTDSSREGTKAQNGKMLHLGFDLDADKTTNSRPMSPSTTFPWVAPTWKRVSRRRVSMNGGCAVRKEIQSQQIAGRRSTEWQPLLPGRFALPPTGLLTDATSASFQLTDTYCIEQKSRKNGDPCHKQHTIGDLIIDNVQINLSPAQSSAPEYYPKLGKVRRFKIPL